MYYCHAVNPDEAIALALQQKELARYRRTRPRQGDVAGVGFQARGGARVLFLDGGGVKGLAQIESLIQIEQKTGRRITELFDWIVGTSTGAIIALGLVYGMYRYLHWDTGSGVRHVYGHLHWGTGSGLWYVRVPLLRHWVWCTVCIQEPPLGHWVWYTVCTGTSTGALGHWVWCTDTSTGALGLVYGL